jgi:hypothetical protein
MKSASGKNRADFIINISLGFIDSVRYLGR